MITAISMVKNAADVIETYIRENAITIDNFVLLDNMSTDNTVSILNRLLQEGFQIEVIQDDHISYSQDAKMKLLLNYTLEKYDPDFIILLNDDEIIVSGNPNLRTENIKDVIYSLDRGNLYYVNQRTCIPTEEDNRQEKCVAKRQSFCYGDKPEITTKIIIPREIYSDDFQIAQGNHDATGSAIKDHILIKDICIAHYPVRSVEQFQSRELTGWTNDLAPSGRVTVLDNCATIQHIPAALSPECIMSTLPKTWIFDLDGTLLKHNGYKIDGKDTVLPGAKEYLDRLPAEDKILLCTSRTDEYKEMTLAFLKEHQIRYDEILFNLPMGERIVVNDRKPSGLDMAVAMNLERNVFELPEIRREK